MQRLLFASGLHVLCCLAAEGREEEAEVLRQNPPALSFPLASVIPPALHLVIPLSLSTSPFPPPPPRSVLDVCAKAGKPDVVLAQFKQMEAEGLPPDAVAHTILVMAHEKAGRCEAALQALEHMRALGLERSSFTYRCVAGGVRVWGAGKGRDVAGSRFGVVVMFVGVAGWQRSCVLERQRAWILFGCGLCTNLCAGRGWGISSR